MADARRPRADGADAMTGPRTRPTLNFTSRILRCRTPHRPNVSLGSRNYLVGIWIRKSITRTSGKLSA